MMRPLLFPTLGIIGLGQIGASIALAARKAGACKLIWGFDSDQTSGDYCQKKGMIDAFTKPEAMAKDCDLIIIAVPPAAVGGITHRLIPHLGPETVLTDVASVKEPILRYLEEECPGGVNFIPGHPIAGGTQAGPEGANGAVFARKLVILTPPQGVDIQDPALTRVRLFWEFLDANVELMPAEVHDLIYGHVSHLPHMIAFAAHAVIGVHATDSTLHRFLRLSESAPELWCDIILHNQQYTLHALRNYLAMIAHIRSELAQGEAAAEQENKDLAEMVLFPRIAASCLIATVSILEKQSGQRLARYSGAGFADVASPAAIEPESDLEEISKHHHAVVAVLERFEQKLEALASAIESSQPKQLLGLLEGMQRQGAELV